MISDAITIMIAMGISLFIVIAWMISHFGKNPKNGGSPPKESSDVNIMNFTSLVSLFVIMVWLMNDTLDSLMIDTTVSTNVEYTTKYIIHMLSPVISAISIHPV